MDSVNWDNRFIELARYISGWSKDRSTGVGAIIVDNDNRIISMGYNGFPSGTNDSIESRHERPLKYEWTVHAEENAIINAARIGVSTKNATMYLDWFPCAGCMRMIINAGITTVVCGVPDMNHPKYGNEFRISADMAVESNVRIKYHSYTDPQRNIVFNVGDVVYDINDAEFLLGSVIRMILPNGEFELETTDILTGRTMTDYTNYSNLKKSK